MNRFKDKFEESLEFVVSHYRRDAFRPTTVFVAVSRWRRAGVAASVAAGILMASACVYTFYINPSPVPPTESSPTAEQVVAPATVAAPEKIVWRIKFADVPLARVVGEIESVYGVRVAGLDPDDDSRLTLSYEGNAADLIETINDLLGTNLRLEHTPDVSHPEIFPETTSDK